MNPDLRGPAPGPGGRAWRALRRNPPAIAGAAVLTLLGMLALFASFLAPYAEDAIDRERFYHPPQRVRLEDPSGRFALSPSVHATRLADPQRFAYQETCTIPPLYW